MAFRFVNPFEIEAAASWLPALFSGQASLIARLAAHSRLLGEVSQCLEGWRTSPDPLSSLHDPLVKDSPHYRQANIEPFFLAIERHHCQRPIVENQPSCVLPGDVVIPKIPPLKAALVAESNHRHPIDGNCFLVRGIKPADAAWLLVLLNEKESEDWFLARSKSLTLPRIGLRDLRNYPFPEAPEEVPGWSTRLLAWVEKYSHNAIRLFNLQKEVDSQVSEYFADFSENGGRLASGVREPAVLMASDSWLPQHIEKKYQQRLMAEKGALRLGDLIVPVIPDARRLKDEHSARYRLLTLKEVAGLYLPTVEPLAPATRLGRFFAEPIIGGEVLVSSLVTNPKIVYGDPTLPESIHPIDHWQRLRFAETPGAWALILSSPALGDQFRRLATGSAQQFATAEGLMELGVPDIDINLRKHWQERLDELLADRRQLDAEWQALRLEGRQMVASVWGIPWSDMKERSLK